jgi:hypothetical protein
MRRGARIAVAGSTGELRTDPRVQATYLGAAV